MKQSQTKGIITGVLTLAIGIGIIGLMEGADKRPSTHTIDCANKGDHYSVTVAHVKKFLNSPSSAEFDGLDKVNFYPLGTCRYAVVGKVKSYNFHGKKVTNVFKLETGFNPDNMSWYAKELELR